MTQADILESLFDLYDTTDPHKPVLSNFEEDIIPLKHHIQTLVDTHITTVLQTQEAQIIALCLDLKDTIDSHIKSTIAQTARGN